MFRYKLGANHAPDNMLVVEARCDGKDYPLLDGNRQSQWAHVLMPGDRTAFGGINHRA